MPFARTSERQGTSPYNRSRAEHEEDSDSPGSPGETGVTPRFSQIPDHYDVKKKKPASQKTGFLDSLRRRSDLISQLKQFAMLHLYLWQNRRYTVYQGYSLLVY